MIRSLFTLLSCFALVASAEETKPKPLPPFPETITPHTVPIAGKPLSYIATAGRMPLLKEDGSSRAEIFYISYVQTNATATAQRPVMFCFNGGPGSSAVWLHLGLMGPYRVELPAEPVAVTPPARWIENPHSVLDRCDLVFIDPISTGFSRASQGEDPRQFHGVQEDVDATAEFIRLWITRNGRWLSPKFIAGESYGTIRAAGLASRLQQQGMDLNGILLISTVLEFQTIDFSAGNETVYPLFLPSYTATAWYHHRLPPDLQAQPLDSLLAASEKFALLEYLPALLQSDDALRSSDLVDKLARWSGLSPDYLRATSFRVHPSRFMKELLRNTGKIIGRFDGRYIGVDSETAGDGPEYDPALSAVRGAFTAAMNDYLHSKLQLKSDLTYEILTSRVHPWSYKPFENRYLNMAESLAAAMRQNPALKIYVASGTYDLATPYLATRVSLDRMAIPLERRVNIRSLLYNVGHMMYTDPATLQQMSADMRDFIDWAVPPRPGF